MNKEDKKNKGIVKGVLARVLGIEPDDIEDDDVLKEDLHMSPVDLVDFSQGLTKKGFNMDEIDLSEIESLNDLYEVLI